MKSAGTTSSRGPSSARPATDARTRDRVALSILEHGPSTAADLAERLGLTAAAVRRHLDRLVDDGALEPRDQRVLATRGRGRPARVFAVTDLGRDRFEKAYDDIAVDALRFLADTAGEAAVTAFARHRVDALEQRYTLLLDGVETDDRPEVLAEALTADGFAASVREAPSGDQVCQHHCPVAHVAAEFPQLCEAETELFSRLLGRHVQRLATIAHGDGICTTNVPDAARNPAPTRSVANDGDPHLPIEGRTPA